MQLSEEQIGRLGVLSFEHWLLVLREEIKKGGDQTDLQQAMALADEAAVNFGSGLCFGLLEVIPNLPVNETAVAIMEVGVGLKNDFIHETNKAHLGSTPMPPLNLGANGELPPFPFPKP